VITLVLPQLGLDEWQAEEGIHLRLGGERPKLGGVTGQWLAVLADPLEALLGEAPADVAGHRPKPDVVLLRAGEVHPVRAGRATRHDHQVHLRTAQQLDRGLVAALADDLLHGTEAREALDDGRPVVGLGEQVQVADRLASAAERACRLDPDHARGALQRLDQPVDDGLRAMEVHPLRSRLDALDPLQDELLGPRRQPAH
jgi:hypothetical protein